MQHHSKEEGKGDELEDPITAARPSDFFLFAWAVVFLRGPSRAQKAHTNIAK